MRSQSLQARFRTAVLIIAAGLSGLVTIAVYLSAKSHYLETGEASARASVAAVDRTISVGVYASDDVLLKELVEGLARHPSIARVEVKDTKGQALASASSQDPAAPANGVPANEEAPSFESVLVSPFKVKETIGALDVWLDARRLDGEARRQAGTVAGALVVLLLGMVVMFNELARRLLSRPMHRLAGEMALIVPGTDRRLTLDRKHERDEVGIVTRAANRLLDLQQAALERERAMLEEITALEARYRGIFDSTSAGIVILSADGELLQLNPAFSRLLGAESEQLISAGVPDFASKVFVRPAQFVHLMEQARQSLQPEAGDLELLRSDGRTLWVHCMVSLSTDAGTGRECLEGVMYNITQRKLSERAAQHRAEHDALTGLKSRAYIESALSRQVKSARADDHAVTLMFIDLDGFKGVNDRWGHAAGDAVLIEAAHRLRTLFKRGCDVIGRLGGDELVVMIVGVEATDPSVAELGSRLIRSFDVSFTLPHGGLAKVGASVGVASYPLHAVSARTLIQAADAAMYAVKQSGKGGFVIAEKSAEPVGGEPTDWHDTLDVPAPAPDIQRDPLTGLMDRRQLVDRLTHEHARVQNGAEPVGVICLDIDQFKLINVAHGARVGDEVLCEASRRLGLVMRRGDVLARTGSDEFVAIVSADGGVGNDMRHAVQRVTRKLLDSLSEPFMLSGHSLPIRASAGISLISAGAAEGLDALREAQLALRRSKSLGRGDLTFFEQQMMAGLHDRIALQEDLRTAIGTPQMFLHVQPKVDRAGGVIGGEALLRWKHPTRGLVPPDQFIPLAEASGAIIELGRWVLRAGCDILLELRRHGSHRRLAINISPVQFNHPDFVADVRDSLSASGASADGLILEITEGLLITDMTGVTERLRELVAIGVRFSIDDFGTGFSSLAYLRQLPLHEIKIDRSFITGLPGDVASAGIVRSIISMGSHLGLDVVAEGVETSEQSDFLRRHGCPLQQGWLHARPMPAMDFLAYAGKQATAFVATETASL